MCYSVSWSAVKQGNWIALHCEAPASDQCVTKQLVVVLLLFGWSFSEKKMSHKETEMYWMIHSFLNGDLLSLYSKPVKHNKEGINRLAGRLHFANAWSDCVYHQNTLGTQDKVC